MGSKGNESKRPKPMRKRSQTRRLLQDCVINMAEARREIVQALQLHRSTRTATTSATVAAACSSSSAAAAQCCYYSLTESMPVSEPIWSTTSPTIFPLAPSAAAAPMESSEFDWGESESQEAAAYNWWLGFLKTLDSKKNNNVENYSKYPHFGYQDNLKFEAGKFVDAASHDQQNSAPDEWLMFPTSDDQLGDQTTTNPLD